MVVVPLVLVLGTFAVVVRKLASPIANTDTYFHIRMGQEFLDGWSARAPGSVTSFATADWLPSQWLGQVAYGTMGQWFGLPGVAWLSGAVALSFALTVFVVARRESSLVVASFVVPVTVVACSPGLSGRPQVVSYLLATVVTAAWLQTRRSGRLQWWIIPVTWFWAMVHGMWSVSAIISIVAIGGLLLERAPGRPPWWKMALVPVLSVVAAGFTPVGPGLYSTVVTVGSINHYFTEWGPTVFTHPSIAIATVTMVVWLVVGIRKGPIPWTHLALGLLAGAWILYSNRTVAVGAAMLVPLLAAQLGKLVPRRAPSKAELPTVLVGFALALGVLAAVVPHTASESLHDGNRAHESVAGLPAGTPLLNEWNEGGFDMWAHPALNIVMHGYGDMFTAEEIERNYDFGSLDAGWSHVLDELNVRDALLYEDGRVTYALTELLGWRMLVSDDGLVHLQAPDTPGPTGFVR